VEPLQLYPLAPMPQARRISEGEAAAIVRNRQPRTITEILQAQRKAMELEDAYVAWLEGKPVPQFRHPRRTLRGWLFGRRPAPAFPPPMTEIVPVWRDEPQ
jgi:hypothetical protein